MRICDECMSERVHGGVRPHSHVFGPNGTRWRSCKCGQCGRTRDCVNRLDLKPRPKPDADDQMSVDTAIAVAVLSATMMGE